MRTFHLAVTGLIFIVTACSSYGTSVVSVEKPAQVASVSIALPSPSLVAGQTQRGVAIVKDANGARLSNRATVWFTSSGSVATVTDSGVIQALAPGAATVTAVSEGVSGAAPLTVIARPPTPVARVLVAVTPPAVVVGQTAQATAALQDSSGSPLSGRSVTWQSGNTSVATVSGNGAISAVGPGTASITAASEGKTASASLSVSAPAPIPVASVSVSPATSSLLVGALVQLSATARDANNNVLTGRVVGWSSANAGIASVNSNGLVSAVSAGTTQITVSSEGQSATAAITVSAPAPVPVASVSVSPATSSVQIGSTVQLSATTRDANNNVLTGRVITWSSGTLGVATVSSSGLVMAVAAGSAQITATSEGKSGSATLNVVTPPPPPPPGSSNEPAGMAIINERDFSSHDDAAWYYTGPELTIETDATAPKSPSNIGRITYPPGSPSGSSNGHTDFALPASKKTLYVSYYGRYSSNWYGDASGVNKIMYFWCGNADPIIISGTGAGNAVLVPEVRLQLMVSSPSEVNYGPNLVPGAVITRGQWFHLEVVAGGNSAGTADGTIDWYLDGVHVGSIRGLQFTAGATAWTEWRWYPVWGGAGGPPVPATQWQDADDIYLSGKN